MLLAPLYKAGNRALPLALLELAAIGFLLVLALKRPALPRLPLPLSIALAVLLTIPLLQLVPLPGALWRSLPGHAEYVSIVARFAAPEAAPAGRTLSVLPAATEFGWLALLPPLACLLAAITLAPAQVLRLLLAMTVFAGAQGLLGLLQVGAGGESIFYMRNTQAFGTATGTFVNRNHYAGLLAMMLPVIVGLLIYDMRMRRRAGRLGDAMSANLVAQRVLLFASAVLVLLALIFTFSRSGIATALVGLAFSSILLVRRGSGTRHAKLIVGALVVAGIALAILIGVAPLLAKFEPAELELSGGGRLALYTATLRAAIEFAPFGSGISTFATVFPRFQDGAFGGYIDYAHNDYLQFFMEAGFAAVAVIALFAAAYAMRMHALLLRSGGRSFTVLQLAAGVALIAPMLHAMFDFGLHMPANAMWFATLAGVMLHPGVADHPEPAA